MGRLSGALFILSRCSDPVLELPGLQVRLSHGFGVHDANAAWCSVRSVAQAALFSFLRRGCALHRTTPFLPRRSRNQIYDFWLCRPWHVSAHAYAKEEARAGFHEPVAEPRSGLRRVAFYRHSLKSTIVRPGIAWQRN